MITDVRAQVDLIAALHLEALFKMGHLESAGDQGDRAPHSAAAIPHSSEQDSLQLRQRLAVIQTLAIRARGLTIKSDMAQNASIRKNDAASSQLPPNAAAEEDIYRKNVW